ncbi:hypothetical protein BUE93_20750 [Chromobacterium amazonense]|uniref:Rha family transcriptional regulator n=1 Tax=Chromobacterium amazonense TaxID=1382803 RepID=A0A2S9WZ09_9NEIS|nr:Rha family transcriptional regulator [Chromobacterium amazonense]PRP68698.1 hypothetical protein BUE93_20750 [Chromobacterium amazonense]
MQDLTVSSLNDFVMLAGDKIVTDSRRVAKAFKKQHKNVLRAYDAMECSEEFRRLNFEPRDYYDERGKKWRLIEMTKDGFMFLAMGFTGKEAATLKEAFIGAFNAMAEQLQRRDMGLWQQMQELITREVESKLRASFGSRLMLERKREKPRLETERHRLEGELQPGLLLN